MNREQLLKLKKWSAIGVVIGLIFVGVSSFSYLWSDHELMKLDQGRLDQTILK